MSKPIRVLNSYASTPLTSAPICTWFPNPEQRWYDSKPLVLGPSIQNKRVHRPVKNSTTLQTIILAKEDKDNYYSQAQRIATEIEVEVPKNPITSFKIYVERDHFVSGMFWIHLVFKAGEWT